MPEIMVVMLMKYIQREALVPVAPILSFLLKAYMIQTLELVMKILNLEL